jgi:hypothetical protein
MQSGKMQDSCWPSAMVQEPGQFGVGRMFTQRAFNESFSGKTFSLLHSSIPEFNKYIYIARSVHTCILLSRRASPCVFCFLQQNYFFWAGIDGELSVPGDEEGQMHSDSSSASCAL